jgi:tRNA pseudouridine13 synthase
MISFQQTVDRFHVEEVLRGPPEGDGPFRYVRFEKRGASTAVLERAVSERIGAPMRSIRRAGMKDAVATAVQWLSWPIAEERRELAVGETMRLPAARGADSTPGEAVVLETTAGTRPLALGAIAGNRFRLRLEADREIGFSADLGLTAWQPNYYGPQRRRDEPSPQSIARALCEARRGGRGRDRMRVSAWQSGLFDDYLRLQFGGAEGCGGDWPIDGFGFWMRPGGRAAFRPDPDEDMASRFALSDAVPAGPIFGYKLAVDESERAYLARLGLTTESFRRWGKLAVGARRAALMRADWRQPPVRLEDGATLLDFCLPSGSYATVFLCCAFGVKAGAGEALMWPNFLDGVMLSAS